MTIPKANENTRGGDKSTDFVVVGSCVLNSSGNYYKLSQ